MIVFHDPWDALCLAEQLPGRSVATFGGPRQEAEFAARGIEAILLPPAGELQTLALLSDPSVDPGNEAVICFKPSARLEALGYRLAHAPASIAQGLENKLQLAAIAEEAGVPHPLQGRVVAGSLTYTALTERFGQCFVAQAPRGHAGKKTYRVESQESWESISAAATGRPLRVSAWVGGQPGTVNAVVDAQGRVLVSAAIVQVTGDPRLTPHPLGSCGNDFTWRLSPDPSPAAAALAEALGPVLAQRGYRGHFGVDWVFDGTHCQLIEINPRLTASFGLYCRHQPRLLHAHLAATAGESIEAGRLPPVQAGQLIVTNGTDGEKPPISGPDTWPHPGTRVAPGGRRGRIVVEGPVVDTAGQLVTPPMF